MLDKFKFLLQNNRKPVIAISYDYRNWILERFAKHIKRLNKNKYNFLLFSVHHLRKHPLYYEELFKHVDLILNMLPSVLLDITSLTDKPVINMVHHWVDDEKIRPYVENSEYIITVSDQWTQKLVDVFNYPRNKISMIHCGIEKDFLKDYKPLFAKNDDLITVGFFAKNTSNEQDRKGTENFKDFISYLKENNVLNKFRIVISGAGWENFIEEIRQQGAEVIYNEFTSDEDMPRLYRSLDFYLMLSKIEGGPATIIEGMALKTPVVSTNIGLVRDIGEDGKNIIIVDNTNPEQIYNKIMYYYNNKDLRENIINNAHKLAQSMTYDNLFKAFSPIFDSFLCNYKRGLVTKLNLKATQKFLNDNVPSTIKGKK